VEAEAAAPYPGHPPLSATFIIIIIKLTQVIFQKFFPKMNVSRGGLEPPTG
jgi:hypothetical protein